MLLDFDVRKLNEALNDFYNVTGVGISILREDYSPLGAKKANNPYCQMVQSSKQGLIRCLNLNRKLLEECKTTKKPTMRICHAGLIEIAVPIVYNEEVIAYAVLGHVKASDTAVDCTEALKGLPVDDVMAAEIFMGLPTCSEEKFVGIINMVKMFGKCMILENFICPKENENIKCIKEYVSENIDKKITVNGIAKGVHVSKSSLYSIVRNHYGCTVNEYINKVKIDKAKELLLRTDKTVEDISEILGFTKPSYFGKAFKRMVGISPMKFRKNQPMDI